MLTDGFVLYDIADSYMVAPRANARENEVETHQAAANVRTFVEKVAAQGLSKG